jgi:hypothetical protein
MDGRKHLNATWLIKVHADKSRGAYDNYVLGPDSPLRRIIGLRYDSSN